MKWLLTIGILLSLHPGFSQQAAPAILASQITSSCRTDLEKVRAIFNWITENISYNTGPRNKTGATNPAYGDNTPDAREDEGPLKSLNERVAENVLRKRVAMCDGYARLFTVLCDHAGIRSEIITGYATNNINKPVSKFGVNHYWNAVFCDNAWHLLDVTWASGYVTRETNEFVREYDTRYFLARPEEFIRDHFPDDCRWTLLPETTMPKEFRNSPFRQKSFCKYRITSFYPKGGIIEVSPGDTIHFEIETADVGHDLQVSPDLLIDSAIFSWSPASVFLKPSRPETSLTGGGKISYDYPVTSPDKEWLYLMYNDDLILRYKIRMKKEVAKN